jgi:hypothetical protein
MATIHQNNDLSMLFSGSTRLETLDTGIHTLSHNDGSSKGLRIRAGHGRVAQE